MKCRSYLIIQNAGCIKWHSPGQIGRLASAAFALENQRLLIIFKGIRFGPLVHCLVLPFTKTASCNITIRNLIFAINSSSRLRLSSILHTSNIGKWVRKSIAVVIDSSIDTLFSLLSIRLLSETSFNAISDVKRMVAS